jgi:hypothetical protein
MSRLTPAAANLLKAAIDRHIQGQPAGTVQRQIALKRIEKLLLQSGPRATEAELRDLLSDLFPTLDDAAIKAAARANRPLAPHWRYLRGTAIALTIGVGGVALVNLPYPMIRWPVARVAPILLLPSFIRMDYDYRGAIAQVEQADQLVNTATSAADLSLGATKVKAAQKHLDALPVWFLGYYPQGYCGWFGCSWRFTLDEFQQARKSVARMEARLFQETNAQTALDKAKQTIETARQQVQAAPDGSARQGAIAQWQQGLDQLAALPVPTLASTQAKPFFTAAERDFQKIAGLSEATHRSDRRLQAAQDFAAKAQQLTDGPAQSAAQWQAAIQQWQNALAPLQQVTVDEPAFNEAQRLLANYTQRKLQAEVRLQDETEAKQAFRQAEQLRTAFTKTANSLTPDQFKGELMEIETQLTQVKPGTTVYPKAQELLAFVQKRLKK